MKRLHVLTEIIMISLLVFVGACGDYVTNVDPLIDLAEDPKLTDESQVDFIINGVKASWASHYSEMSLFMDIMSDALFEDVNNNPQAKWATYVIPGQLDPSVPLTVSFSNDLWKAAAEIRFFAGDLVRRAEEITFTDKELEKEAFFWGYFIGGLARYFYAAWWGLNEEEGGGVISESNEHPGQFIPSDQMYDLAVEKLNMALDFAPDDYMTRVVNSIKARIHLFDGDYGTARTAAQAGLIVGDPPFQSLHSDLSPNTWWQDAGNGLAQCSLDPRFRTYVEDDPNEETRLPMWSILGEDGVTLFWIQNIVKQPGDPLDFVTWQENELILAELDLRDGADASALIHINNIRASHGLSDLTSVDMDLLIREREKELVMHGIRIVDQRRFGLWHLPGRWQYMPIAEIEREANPNLH